MQERIREIRDLAKVPMKTEQETKRVEIIMLTFKQPEVETKAIQHVIERTKWPYKLTCYDNRPNTANTSRIWNKLISEATCDYILLIDSDAFVPDYKGKCWLTRMMESIDEKGVVIPVGDNVGGAHQKASGATEYPDPVINNGIWSGYCFLFTKEAYKKYGKFDERFYLYGQDSEWAHRTSKDGVIMRKDVFVKHKGSYSMDQNPLREADKIMARLLFQRMTQ